jgi:hypothetical protein
MKTQFVAKQICNLRHGVSAGLLLSANVALAQPFSMDGFTIDGGGGTSAWRNEIPSHLSSLKRKV